MTEYERLLGVLKNPAALADNADALEAELTRLYEACEGKSRMIKAQQGLRAEIQAENTRLHTLIAAAKKSWDALGACEDEFGSLNGAACSEHRNALDGALVRLGQAVCDHETTDGRGVCLGCGLTVPF